LSEAPNASIPKHIRDQFPQDDNGRVLFFTTPPVDTRRIIESGAEGEKGRLLAHSAAYLAVQEREKMVAERKRALGESDSHSNKKLKPDSFEGEVGHSISSITTNPENVARGLQGVDNNPTRTRQIQDLSIRALKLWADQTRKGTEDFYKYQYGDKWQEMMKADEMQGEKERKQMEEMERREKERRRNMITSADYMTQISNNPWTGVYLDDQDPRYGF